MKTKLILMAAGVVVIGGIVALALFNSSPAADKTAPEKAGGGLVSPTANGEVALAAKPPLPETVAAPAAAAASPQKSDDQSQRVKPADAVAADSSIRINGYEVQDPMARVMLNFVGSDPEANAYWIGAINDPALPAEERKDLIEDLNEDGLSDPKHPGPQDLPLILNRIRLIEQLTPGAMDQVNADALAEAHKDLNDLLAGKPVN